MPVFDELGRSTIPQEAKDSINKNKIALKVCVRERAQTKLRCTKTHTDDVCINRAHWQHRLERDTHP